LLMRYAIDRSDTLWIQDLALTSVLFFVVFLKRDTHFIIIRNTTIYLAFHFSR
jgi:hypothetical protein